MRFPGISGRLRSLAPILGALGSAVALVALAPLAHAHILADCTVTSSTTCPTPTPTPPPPTPTPVNAFLSLDVTAGDPNTQITVNGGAFLPNESMTLYWDAPNKVAGGANADSSGNFITKVKPFSGDAPGQHRLCASVPPSPCAGFALQPLATTPSPQDSPSPSPDTSPSPSPSATPNSATFSPTPAGATINGLDVMLKPPFVILPIIGGLGLAIALVYWILSVALRPKPTVLKSVAVTHVATRPDYAAGFGTPPPAAAPAAPPPSAWTDVIPPAAAATAAAAPEAAPIETAPQEPPPEASAATEPAPAVEPPAHPEPPPSDLPAVPDEPPDLPEPGDY